MKGTIFGFYEAGTTQLLGKTTAALLLLGNHAFGAITRSIASVPCFGATQDEGSTQGIEKLLREERFLRP